jgi:hypothetical protein
MRQGKAAVVVVPSQADNVVIGFEEEIVTALVRFVSLIVWKRSRVKKRCSNSVVGCQEERCERIELIKRCELRTVDHTYIIPKTRW